MDIGGTRKWGWGARVSAFLLGVIFWVCVLEAIVRIFVEEPILSRFVIDPGYGVRANEPNVMTRHYFPKEYDITVSTNSAGMRGRREYSVAKPAGVHRVVVLGDSMIFGFGAEDEEVVGAVLEDLLNSSADAGRRYEVLNFSVSGFGQAELLVTYRERIRRYDADTVILFYFNNDVGNNAVSELFELTGEDTVRRTNKTYLPGVATQEILYGWPPTRWLFEHSQAWNFVRNRLSSIVQKSFLRREGLTTFSSDDSDAVALTTALLKQFVRDIQGDGARPILVIIPDILMTSNFPMSRETVTESAAELVDTREFLTDQDYYIRDTHIRPSGHRKIAARLAELLAER